MKLYRYAGNGSYTIGRKLKKVGRNDRCPCESGRKYKDCCMSKEGIDNWGWYWPVVACLGIAVIVVIYLIV